MSVDLIALLDRFQPAEDRETALAFYKTQFPGLRQRPISILFIRQRMTASWKK